MTPIPAFKSFRRERRVVQGFVIVSRPPAPREPAHLCPPLFRFFLSLWRPVPLINFVEGMSYRTRCAEGVKPMQLDLRPNVQPVKLWRSHMAVASTHVLAARGVDPVVATSDRP